MSDFPQTDLDLSAQIAALPKHAGYSTLPLRTGEDYVTLHYSGVNYPATNHAGEVQRILDEARYQLNHNYGKPNAPAYPDGLLYDVTVLSDATRVKTRARRQQLWHCGNLIGNSASWAVHLMLGPDQDATAQQWAATLTVIEEICAIYSIPRSAVVGHNEWPRTNGIPQPSPIYRLLAGQSECPGRVLHARLAAWRTAPPPPDRLRERTIPGPPGMKPIHCSARVADFYAARGGLAMCGYPLADEWHDESKDCDILRCERVIIKESAQFGVEQALLSEARQEEWLP